MTCQEFSNTFTTLLNSYNLQTAYGDQTSRREIVLDEYEKSLYLTKAQEELVLSLYSGRNSALLGFEETEEMRRYLSNLVVEAVKTPETNSGGMPLGVNPTKQFFSLPEDVWFITYEAVNTTGDKACDTIEGMEVVPVTQDEFHRIKKNPFRGPNRRRALRLDLADGLVEIVSKYSIDKYYIRYLRKPYPIILEKLPTEPEELSINGKTEPKDINNPCELHEALHQRILDGAVVLALRSKGYNVRESNNENN